MRRVVGGIGAAVGAAGFVVCLVAATVAMREFMIETGGACASGGPYISAQECPAGTTALLFGGLLGGIFFALLLAGSSAALGGPVLAPALAMWAATFGAFGWNFIDLGILDPPGGEVEVGWAISGALFWAMALGGLVPAAIMAVHRIRRGSVPPEPVFTQGPLVRAAVLPPDPPGR